MILRGAVLTQLRQQDGRIKPAAGASEWIEGRKNVLQLDHTIEKVVSADECRDHARDDKWSSLMGVV